MLELDHLRSFVAILDTGSFTRASERVNKTQPSVSAHVRHLENLLGCALFEKSGRGVRVSEDGERLAEYARRMIALETAALSAVRKGSMKGRVRFGIPDDYAEPLLPRILQQVIRSHPALEIMVVCESSFGLAERIAASDIDLALVTDSGTFHGIEVVREEPLLWVASSKFALDLEETIPLALGGANCQWRQAAEQALAEAGLKARLVLGFRPFLRYRPHGRFGRRNHRVAAKRDASRNVQLDRDVSTSPATRDGVRDLESARQRQ